LNGIDKRDLDIMK